MQLIRTGMVRSVFISYARIPSGAHAQALAANLGLLAFLDTAQVDEGDPFPQRLLDGLLDAHVAVIFASRGYLESRSCRLEMRLALAGNPSNSNLILALDEGARDVLNVMPQLIADVNWPLAEATVRIEALVRRRLADHPIPLRQRLSNTEAQRLKLAFLNESNMLEPQPIQGVVCSLPQGVSAQSIGSRFTGRAEELRHLHRILTEGTGARARLISRMTAGGGFGKTRLATEYLHRYGSRYYPGGLFWVNASSNSIEAELWRILNALDVGIPDLATMREQRRDIRQELGNALRRINLPLYMLSTTYQNLLPVRNRGPLRNFVQLGSVTVLATSRQDTREEGVNTIPVDTIGRDAAILLLTDGVAESGRLSWADWGCIADWVGDLPLALDLLNRCLAFNSVTAEKLLSYASSPPGPTKELDRLGDALKGQTLDNARRGITEAFEISFETLREESKIAALILAQFSPASIPEALFSAMPEECTHESIRTDLRSRHFVTYGGAHSFGVMHRLTADALRSLAGERSPETAAVAMLSMARAFPRGDDRKTWPACAALLPHALAILDNVPEAVEGFEDEGWLAYRKKQLSESVGRYREQSREEEDSEELFNSALHFAEDEGAAVIAARRFLEFNLRIRRRMMRMAFEQPNNNNLQPIRDAFDSQPMAFREEIKLAVLEAAELADKLRNLLAQKETDTKEEAITALVVGGVERFPLDLQDNVKRAFESQVPNESKSFIEQIGSLRDRQRARTDLYRVLGVAEPAVPPAKVKGRWNWLKTWRSK